MRFRQHVHSLGFALAVLPATVATVSAQEKSCLAGSLEAAITELDAEITAAEARERAYDGGLLATVAALNTETLRLTRSVLEARKAAEDTGAPIEITVPAVQPDPKVAAEILADIQAQQKLAEEARAEAEGAGGLMAAMALTRYETERLSLAQLRQAWYRAQYGIAFPTPTAPAVGPATPVSRDPMATPGGTPDDPTNAVPAWVDPAHPDIDYTASIFGSLAGQKFEMAGWWAVERSRAEIDDSPQIFAINVSDWGGNFQVTHPSLKVACLEREARLIFDADDFLLSDFQSNTMLVTVRVGDTPAEAQRWSKLTTNSGAGLFGTEAEAMFRRLVGEERVFLRATENNGETHDLSIQIAGADRVFEEIAATCGFSLLDLGQADYRAIQTMLNAGGFEAGTPDGQWGSGSRAAMARYQASVGLAETSVPNRETLERMGIALDGQQSGERRRVDE